MANIENLRHDETHTALRFLLYRMSMDTRRQMMAELPVIYAQLFPTVSAETLTTMTREVIDTRRANES